MTDDKENKKISKFVSLVLRHKPEVIGLTIDRNGWATTNELLEKINAHGQNITAELLDHIVAANNKKRFSFNKNKTKIRANQGHSLDIDLNLEETTPPEYLYHGTGERTVATILASGIDKRERQQVHLSADEETAKMVGQRHGKPKILIVCAGQMKADGFTFYLSDNNVWLTDHVPAMYLKLA